MTYLRSSNLQYKLETQSGFSVTAGFKYDTQEATKWLPFVDGYGNIYKKYHEASFNLTLRYAPCTAVRTHNAPTPASDTELGLPSFAIASIRGNAL